MRNLHSSNPLLGLASVAIALAAPTLPSYGGDRLYSLHLNMAHGRVDLNEYDPSTGALLDAKPFQDP